MFFERHEGGDNAILVHVDFTGEQEREDPSEFLELVASAGANAATLIRGSRQQVNAKFFVGSGKVDEIREAAVQHEADVVIFNHGLTPSQERNLERSLKCRVLDRTGLILDIFAQRARTHEGKLQVELAQLQYMRTRLVRGWTHLERQKGGIGLRGPGETQLETDRRLLQIRISQIQKRLDKVRQQRANSRRARDRAEIPSVSLVGYTNAGKSTLFNHATTSEVYAADQLFATLDPTLRRLALDDVGPIVLADTVGFIRHLPHKLVEAFQATLQEATEADLLLHVVDAASVERDDNIAQVNDVLHEIGAGEIPVLMIYNKIDLLEQQPRIERDDKGQPERVWLSAATGAGLDLLRQAMSERLADRMTEGRLQLGPSEGKLRSQLYALGAVRGEHHDDQGDTWLDIRLQERDLNQLLARLGVDQAALRWA